MTLAHVLDELGLFLQRYVVFGRPEEVIAVVLWIAHTHAIEYAEATGYLAITSPEKGSGKTRLLELLRLLAATRRGSILITPTASTIYRTLEASPEAALLLDELDAVFKDHSDKYEEVRAVINAGHRRGATVPRSVSIKNAWAVKHFEVFCPKALSGIGRLPDTIADRSIPIRMLKKKSTETVERFRTRIVEAEAAPLVTALVDALEATPPALEADVPIGLPDRAADAWEALLAIADIAGEDWPSKARKAAVILHADREQDDSLNLRALSDCRLAFERADVERMATAALIEALKSDEESPWVDERRPLTPERFASLLRPFRIRSKQLKIAGIKVRGFERSAFVDSWDRYLPPSPVPPPLDPVSRYAEHERSTGIPGSTPPVPDPEATTPHLWAIDDEPDDDTYVEVPA